MNHLYISGDTTSFSSICQTGANGILTGYGINNNLNLLRLYRKMPKGQCCLTVTDKFLTSPNALAKPKILSKLCDNIISECALQQWSCVFFNSANYGLFRPVIEHLATMQTSLTVFAICGCEDGLPQAATPILCANPKLPFKPQIEIFKAKHPSQEVGVFIPISTTVYPLPDIKNESHSLPIADGYHIANQNSLTMFFDEDYLQSYFTACVGDARHHFYHVESCESVQKKLLYLKQQEITTVFLSYAPLNAMCQGCSHTFLPYVQTLLAL